MAGWSKCRDCGLELRLDAGRVPEHYLADLSLCPGSSAAPRDPPRPPAGPPYDPFAHPPYVEHVCARDAGCARGCRFDAALERLLAHIPPRDSSADRWRPWDAERRQ